MENGHSLPELLEKITRLENRLEESEQLIEAIKAGEVDAFAINTQQKAEIYTLQSGDYAYRVLIEAFNEGAINLSEDGLIVYTNTYFCDLLQTPYEKILGTSIFELIAEESKENFETLFKEALAGNSKGEINLHLDSKSIPVYISMTSLQPRLATIGIIISDLTEKKKSEGIILHYQEDLEQKNFELSQSNNELASFAYIASHDLQEPLRKIQTFASRIISMEEDLPATVKDNFDRMKLAAGRMQRLIEDLLNYSQTNTVEKKFEYADLNKLTKEVKEELAEEIEQRNAVIEADDLCNAYIIPFQFKQMLHNLIGNSLKFSKKERQPIIKISSKHVNGEEIEDLQLIPEKKYCHIRVTDNGIGFEPEYSSKIFDIFSRLHGKEVYKGTGIGLAIVKKITENHQGVIKANGELDKGASFDIYLPTPSL